MGDRVQAAGRERQRQEPPHASAARRGEPGSPTLGRSSRAHASASDTAALTRYVQACVVLALGAAGAGAAALVTNHGSPATRLALGAALGLLVALVAFQRQSQRYIASLIEGYRRAHQLAQLNSAVIASFAMAIDAKDQHTHGHTERVREISRLIGEQMGLSEDELEALKTAAMLHDIGKLAIPDHILSKPEQLTPEEMNKVKTHTLVGCAILEPVQFPWPVIPIIRSHHECWDGSGYPDGLAGEQIPLAARILAVADVYDALLSHRPYRPAMTVQDAVAYMRDRSGSQFDPKVIEACFQVLAAQQESHRFGFIFDGNAATDGRESADRQDIFRDIKQAHQELLALYEIVQTMGRSLNMQETLDLIISKSKRIIEFSTCVLFLRQSEDETLKAMAASGPYAERILDRRLPLGAGVSGAVAKTGVASGLTRSATDDLLLLLGPEARECSLTEVLAAPLGAEGEIIGTLTFYRPAGKPFTEDDARLLSSIARQATVAISNARQYEQTKHSALTDQLTGLRNARYFFMHLEQELNRARPEGKPVSLIAIDLNNLKQINDNFGHQQGDRALRILAEVFLRHVRDQDTVVRYAGDEFFIILPDTTNQQAREMGERIKQAVRETRLEVSPNRAVNLGASLGVATFPGDAKEADALIAEADRAMYRDKHLSRQVALISESERRARDEQVGAGTRGGEGRGRG